MILSIALIVMAICYGVITIEQYTWLSTFRRSNGTEYNKRLVCFVAATWPFTYGLMAFHRIKDAIVKVRE